MSRLHRKCCVVTLCLGKLRVTRIVRIIVDQLAVSLVANFKIEQADYCFYLVKPLKALQMRGLIDLKNIPAVIASEKAVLICLLTISIIFNLLLTREVVQSRNQLALLIKTQKLTIGEAAPSLKALNELGEEIEIDFKHGSLPTVIYFHSRTCFWCDKNVGNFHDLVLQASGKYRLINLLLEPYETTDKSQTNSEIQVLFAPSVESKLSYNLYSTPTTILVSPDGRIEKIWKGAYNYERKTDIEKMLGISLSDLANEDLKQ